MANFWQLMALGGLLWRNSARIMGVTDMILSLMKKKGTEE